VLLVVGMRSLIVLALLAGVAAADVTVTVRSTTDNSHSTTGTESKKLEDLMRRTIEGIAGRAPLKLPGNRHVDASLELLTTDFIGSTLVVSSVIRVIVTDDAGRITSVLGTSARVESAARKSRIAQLREEAVVGALEGGYLKVKDRVHGKPAIR
jgi:hypothetical protein